MRRPSKSELDAIAREVAAAQLLAPLAQCLAFDIRTEIYGRLLGALSLVEGEEWEFTAGMLERCGYGNEPDIDTATEAEYRRQLSGLVALASVSLEARP